ncbi:hypothetical protein PhCBS80983_g03225 [Powellomyces hirtus]|uniref:Acidic fibroblast growth factor binding protein n=1 Tax=Powellomyces hirtus TaxID=109895 RepID=A0A507E3B1_9FUNG|nr:hypothetical protein PhCBS80983_g03225 [Powellomyces hirtus]
MDFSVFVANTPVFDKSIWQLWLFGLTVEQSTAFMCKRRPNLQSSPLALRHYIMSQYRTYDLLEPHLHRPKHLLHNTNLLFPISATTRTYLIETFYSFHPSVMRHVLGKKFSSRVRKDLEDVCAKTNVPIGGCRRMFDNFKRVVKVVEDAERDVGAVVAKEFLLPRPLADQYAHIIFINNYRLDTFKRKLTYLKFSDFEYVASIFMTNFTHPTTPILDDLDATLSQDARDIKSILFTQKGLLDDYRTLVASKMSPVPANFSDSTFKTILRGVLVVGAGLAHRKELRDVFVTIQERVVDPALVAGWSVTDLDVFLNTVKNMFVELRPLDPQLRKRYAKSVQRLFESLRLAAMRFYEAGQSI